MAIQFYLNGSDNADYRSIIKKVTEATWDYANKITHSCSATHYEASTCVSLCIALVGAYENVLQKVHDPISQQNCPDCKSKRLTVESVDTDENGKIKAIHLICEECKNTFMTGFAD